MNALTALTWDPPAGAGWLFALLAVAVVAYAVYVYRTTEAPLGGGTRALLSTLRALLLLLVIAVLCRPVLSLAVPSGADRGVAILYDVSRSLGLPGVDPADTRAAERDRARAGLVTELGGRFPLIEIPFAERVGIPVEPTVPLGDPSGEATALADALAGAVAAAGVRPGAVVLVTDGTQTSGPDPVPAARRLGGPVSAVALGANRPVDDLTLVRVRANRDAFVGERTPLEAVLRLQGLPASEVEVRLVDVTDGEEELARETVALEPGGAERRVGLSFEPTRVGLRFLEVRVSGVDGEATRANDRRLFAVDVREDKTGVLLLSGSLTWEHSFLRRALDADSTLAVTGGIWNDGRFRGARPGERIPALDAAGLREVKVLILDHVEPRQLPGGAVSAIAAYVRAGGGLVMIAGSGNSLGPWAGTPLAELFPVTLVGGGARGEVLPRLSTEASHHALFDPTVPGAPGLDAWSDLPPVLPAAGVGAARGHAVVLLTAAAAEGGIPLLTWGAAGQGSVLLFAGEGLWRWGFLGVTHRPAGNVMPGWWRRTVQWMSRPDVDARLEVHPVEAVVPRGRPVAFVARTLDETYRPLDGVPVDLELRSDPDSGGAPVTLRLTGEDGFLRGQLPPLPPGRYRYVAEAVLPGDGPGRVEGRLAVDSLGVELERLETDHELLRRLAEATGGGVWSPDSLVGMGEAIRVAALAESERRQIDLWNHPAVFALFVLLGSSEWLLRRRRGLI